MQRLIGSWLGVTTACVIVVAAGDSLTPNAFAAPTLPTSRSALQQAEAWGTSLLAENCRLRRSEYGLKCEVAGLKEALAGKLERDKERRAAMGGAIQRAGEMDKPEFGPDELIPPQNLPVPARTGK